MKSLKYYFKKAGKQGWAVGQFNFSNLRILKAIVLAAQENKSPVIVGTSEGESRSIGLKQAVALIKSFRRETQLPIFLNLDHGKTFGYIKKAIDAGYDAVHFDGSRLPLARNIRETKKVVKYAKKSGVFVEGEVGMIGGALTCTEEAQEFIKKTGVDSLAVAVGNLHGIRSSGINPNLNLKRLKEIKKKAGSLPLVLHGGSGTPQNDIKKAIKLGIAKVNINTELRLAYLKALKKALKRKSKKITLYKYMPRVIEAVQKVVEDKIKLFGSLNKV